MVHLDAGISTAQLDRDIGDRDKFVVAGLHCRIEHAVTAQTPPPHQRDIMGGGPGVLQQGSGPDYRWREGAACRALRDGVWGIRFGVGKPGRGVQPPLREPHPLGARICAGCPVRRPLRPGHPVDNDQNHLPAGILLPAESMRPAWLRARRALLRVADGIYPCPVLWP